MVDSKAAKTARKFSGVMLALKIEDARILRDFILTEINPALQIEKKEEGALK